MMKRKKYIKPESREIVIEPMVILAGSDPQMDFVENNVYIDEDNDGTNDFDTND